MDKKPFLVMQLIVLASIFLLVACQTKQSPVFSTQCIAPCWRQIEPGKTDSTDALNTINKFIDIDLKSMSVSGPWNIFSGFVHFKLNTGETVRVYSMDDIVVLITFNNPGGIASFENCVKIFGIPEYVAQSSTLGSGSPVLPASDAIHTLFFVVSPSKGISFGYDTYGVWPGANYDLTQDTMMSKLRYFDIQKYDQLLNKGFLIDAENGFSKDKLQVWRGYGNIAELYPEK